MCSATCGASVGAGSGRVSTTSVSAAVTLPASTAASSRDARPGVLTGGGLGRAQADHRANQQDAGQAAITSSVNAASTAASRTQGESQR